MKLSDLPTPCAVVDLDRVERNTGRMAKRMAGLGVNLRPHVKTHKTAEAAWMQVLGHSGGVTVSTLAEARFLAEAGFRDITWAFPAPPDRLKEMADLSKKLDRFHFLVDNETMVKAMEDHGGPFSVFLKFDCGDHRAGVDPESEHGITLAKRLGSALAGVLTHAGHSYGSKSADEIRKIAAEERDCAVRFSEKLRKAGIDVKEVSIGSTPTMNQVDNLGGITEVRPGNYVFHDVFQATIGSCSLDDVAFSVLTTVAGTYPDRLIVNAGALAMSKDPGPTHVLPDPGYGRVCGLDGKPIDGLHFFSLSQEHGQIRGKTDLTVGARLRILPNHSCLTAANFDRYHVVRGEEVVAEWKPVKGW